MWRNLSAASLMAVTTWVIVAGRRYGDAGHEVDVPIAVHVLDHGTLPASDDQRVFLDVGRRRPLLIPGYNGLAPGAGWSNQDAGIVAYGSLG